MCELLEKAREVQGNISYYEVAKRLNVSDQVMNKWKNNKSQPNGINTLKLALMAEVELVEAIRMAERGYISMSLLFVTSMAGIALSYCINYASTLYIMLNRRYYKI